MRNAVIRKKARALKILRLHPPRIILGTDVTPDWAALSRQSVWIAQ